MSRTTPLPVSQLLQLPEAKTARLSHYLFRYPAKFHPPVIRTLLERFTSDGDTVLDPFVGSGTMLVEAATINRNGIGLDVDPVAVAVARAKVQRFGPGALEKSAATVLLDIERNERSADSYSEFKFADLSDDEYEKFKNNSRLFIPNIPNLDHWFRRYVVVDLARIRAAIVSAEIPQTHKNFFMVVFASIIRNASNADPVPVSGLEVTSHMRRLDAEGRQINPFDLFRKALRKSIGATDAYRNATTGSRTSQIAKTCDATQLRGARIGNVDAVITSPPYHGAVDYYRRHQLEMFWLGYTESQKERLALLPKYIGRPKVPQSDPIIAKHSLQTPLAIEWNNKISAVSPERAVAFRHYVISMTGVFGELSKVLEEDSPAVLVVGNSGWNGSEIPTVDLFDEISADHFEVSEVLHYPVKNRYMSYKRHNDADIAQEHVLVLRRSSSRPTTQS